MNTDSLDRGKISERVIGCAFTVANTLGIGFLEKVYENALALELRKAGLHVDRQVAVSVTYDGISVGTYVTDMIVENAMVIEVKAVRGLDRIHQAQCLNYLRATGLRLCLLLNVATPRLEIRRLVNGL